MYLSRFVVGCWLGGQSYLVGDRWSPVIEPYLFISLVLSYDVGWEESRALECSHIALFIVIEPYLFISLDLS